MKFEEIITDRLILRKFTQESFDSIYSDMSQDEQLDILGLNSIEKLLEEKEKYKKGLSTHNEKFLYHCSLPLFRTPLNSTNNYY